MITDKKLTEVLSDVHKVLGVVTRSIAILADTLKECQAAFDDVRDRIERRDEADY